MTGKTGSTQNISTSRTLSRSTLAPKSASRSTPISASSKCILSGQERLGWGPSSAGQIPTVIGR